MTSKRFKEALRILAIIPGTVIVAAANRSNHQIQHMILFIAGLIVGGAIM